MCEAATKVTATLIQRITYLSCDSVGMVVTSVCVSSLCTHCGYKTLISLFIPDRGNESKTPTTIIAMYVQIPEAATRLPWRPICGELCTWWFEEGERGFRRGDLVLGGGTYRAPVINNSAMTGLL